MQKHLLLIAAFCFLFFPAVSQATVLDYHRSVLTAPRTTTSAVTTTKTDIRTRIAARLRALRSKRLSNTTKETPKTTLQAQNVAFKITIPSDFSVTSDTLLTGSGEMVIDRRNGDQIVVRGTGKRCEGGHAAYFDCFRKHWQARQEPVRDAYAQPKVLKNEELRWRNDVVSVQQVHPNNTGRYYLVEDGNQREALFLFQAPAWGNIWEVEMTGGKTDSFLSDQKGSTRILHTMFADNTSATDNKERLLVNESLKKEHRTASGSRRTQKSSYSKKDIVAITAEAVGFSVEAPRTFYKGEDDLTLRDGSLEIKDQFSRATIEIMASEAQCNSQTSKIIRNCLRPLNEAAQKDFVKDKVNLSLVMQRNYGLKLTGNGADRSDFAYYTLYRSTEKAQRYALLTWREPNAGHIWYAHITAPEDNDSILSNQQKLNAMITSMLYSEK